MTKDPIAAWKKMLREKREWRAHVARVQHLPPDYRMVMEEIEKFMFVFAWDGSMIATLDDILDLLEQGAATGRPVLEVTGDDVAAFARSILAEMHAKSWEGKLGDQLNARIHAELDRDES